MAVVLMRLMPLMNDWWWMTDPSLHLKTPVIRSLVAPKPPMYQGGRGLASMVQGGRSTSVGKIVRVYIRYVKDISIFEHEKEKITNLREQFFIYCFNLFTVKLKTVHTILADCGSRPRTFSSYSSFKLVSWNRKSHTKWNHHRTNHIAAACNTLHFVTAWQMCQYTRHSLNAKYQKLQRTKDACNRIER